VVSADLEADAGARATSCLIEGAGGPDSGDIAAADFPR